MLGGRGGLAAPHAFLVINIATLIISIIESGTQLAAIIIGIIECEKQLKREQLFSAYLRKIQNPKNNQLYH